MPARVLSVMPTGRRQEAVSKEERKAGEGSMAGRAGLDAAAADISSVTTDADRDDVYYYSLGEGRDRIGDSGGTDWLVLTGVGADQLALGTGSLKLTLLDGGEIHLDDFDPDNPYGAGSIEYFQFGAMMSSHRKHPQRQRSTAAGLYR